MLWTCNLLEGTVGSRDTGDKLSTIVAFWSPHWGVDTSFSTARYNTALLIRFQLNSKYGAAWVPRGTCPFQFQIERLLIPKDMQSDGIPQLRKQSGEWKFPERNVQKCNPFRVTPPDQTALQNSVMVF
jgi:hypothetical protein